MFQSLFLQQRGLDAAYLPFGVKPEFLQQAMDGLWALGVEGFNVTVPHKEAVFNRVDCDDDARLIGAVNTVRRAGDGWQATNTDWLGFQAVIDGLDVQLQKRKALLFGAGGTARAILHALSFKGLDTLYVCNRNPERLQSLISFDERNYPSFHCQAVAWQQDNVTQACADAALLINATSIGLNKT
ncbi:MAG: shikimate dehydrogenase, partial [Mariprofundaceae bacterium]